MLTRNRFGATRICHAKKALEQHRMRFVVPVTYYYGEFSVIGGYFLLWVDDEGSAKTVNVLTLIT